MLFRSLFVSFNNSDESFVEYFKGSFSESIIGKKLSEAMKDIKNLSLEAFRKSEVNSFVFDVPIKKN